MKRLYAVVFCVVLATVVSAVTLWALWEARTSKGTCDGLDETTCWQTKYCHYDVERYHDNMGNRDDSKCYRKDGIDKVAGVGFLVSFFCWFGFACVYAWDVETGQVEMFDLGFPLRILAVVVAIVTVFLGALWLKTGSLTSMIFCAIFLLFYFCWLVAEVVTRAAKCLESRKPPSYNTLGEPEEKA